MTPDPDARELQGLAASIDRLFTRESDPAPQEVTDEILVADEEGAGDVAWVAESAVRLPGDVDEPDPLIPVVRRYVRAQEGDRGQARAAVLEAAEDAQGRRAWPALADSAEALALFSRKDPGAMDLARTLTSPGVATLLVERLRSTLDEERRKELVSVLPELGVEVGYALLEALREEALDDDADRSVRRMLIDLIGRCGKAHPELLSEMVEDPNWRVVRNAVVAIAERGGDDAVQNLIVPLGHDRPEVRRETLSALGRLGGEDAVALAGGKLGDPDASVRSQAARTLGLLGRERSLRPLLEALESESEGTVQVELIRALGSLGDPSAVIPIEKRVSGSLFSRPPQEVRLAGYRALASIGTPHAVGLLEKAATDKDPAVQELAASLLKARNQDG